MPLRPILAATTLVAALTLSACGGSSGSESSGSGGATATTTEASTASGSGGSSGSEVKIADFAFDPTDLEVTAGDAVTFTNDDDTEHTATAKAGDPKMFDTEKLGKGDAKEITFDEPGDYEYYCSIHEYMKGTIHVVA